MSTLKEDIKSQSDWIVRAFASDGLTLDYTLDSFKVLDAFIDEHAPGGKPRPGGRLSPHFGPILFSIGGYIGETIIRLVPGSEWITEYEGPKSEGERELDIEIRIPQGTRFWPVQRTVKRMMEGPENCLYDYGYVIVHKMTKDDYWENIRKLGAAFEKPPGKS